VTKAALKRLSAFYLCISISTGMQPLGRLTHVQVDDLGNQRDHYKHQKHVKKPLLELAAVLSRRLGDDGSTETLGCDDTQSSDQTANGDVHHHGFLAILRTEIERNENGCNNDDTCITQKARRNDPLLHVLNARDRRLLWCVHGNDDRSNNAIETSDFSYETQALLQKYGRQYSAYNNRQGSHRCYEDGVGKGVCDKVTYLRCMLACPAYLRPLLLTSPRIMRNMPSHHQAFFK
jgi:hypothetical protein